jgi:hypothetical protein
MGLKGIGAVCNRVSDCWDVWGRFCNRILYRDLRIVVSSD